MINLILLKKEDLEELVKTSVNQSLKNFYREKSKKENLSKNLSVREVAVHLNVSELTVRNYIKRGLIKADRIGTRIFINRRELENSLKEVKSLKYRR